MTEQALILWLVGGIALVGLLLAARATYRKRQQAQNKRAAPRPQLGPSRTSAPPPTPRFGPPRMIKLNELPNVTLIRRGLPLVMPRREDPLWSEKGWRRTSQGFEGFYRAGGRQWRGLIVSPYPGSFEAYIWHPPLADLERRTSHRYCFQGSGVGGRYKVHFSAMPVSLDHAIAAVEAVLSQAVGR